MHEMKFNKENVNLCCRTCQTPTSANCRHIIVKSSRCNSNRTLWLHVHSACRNVSSHGILRWELQREILCPKLFVAFSRGLTEQCIQTKSPIINTFFLPISLQPKNNINRPSGLCHQQTTQKYIYIFQICVFFNWTS